uniref:RNA polymerase II subunit B1 CTD phosphatase RPAP2 homolog n=1 Tax=Macrostomum lignano TaxID=282301 RepID=A0A1I8J6D4_9PLAT
MSSKLRQQLAADKDDVIPPKVAAAAAAAANAAGSGPNSRAFQATARRQRMCTSRAVGIVEQLAGQGSVGMVYFSRVLIYLSRQHYLDAVTERNLTNSCGFPLCPEPLSPTNDRAQQQRYRIIASTRRVYDVTRRKCYCSDACFAQSTYVHDQLIPETPLWLRVGADASASSVDPPPLTADALTETLAAVEPRPGDPVVLDAVAEDLDRLLKISDKPQASEVKEAPKLSTETPAQRPSLAWLDRLVQSTSTATDSAPFATSTASQRADPETAAFAVASDWFTRATRDFLTNRSRPM